MGYMMLLWLVVSVPLFLSYLFTLSPTVPLEDGGEMIRAAFTLGVTHPPGYPFYTLVGRLMCLVPVGDIAFRMNLLSAAASACGGGFLACAAYRLLTASSEPGRRAYRFLTASRGRGVTGVRTSAWWAAGVAAILMGTAPSLWWQSVIAEKYAMNYCFTALILAALAASLASFRSWALPALALVYGLSAGHHGQTVYFAPAVLLTLWWATRRLPPRRRARAATMFVFMVALGISIKFVYPPVRAAQQPLHNWNDPSTWASFTEYVAGRPYQYRIFYWDFPHIARRFKDHALGFLPAQFGWPGVIAGVGGLVWLVRTHPRTALLLASVWVTGVLYCLNFILDGIAIRTYYIPTFVVFSLWMACGLMQAGTWVGRLSRSARLLALAAALGWFLWEARAHRFESNRSRHYFAYDVSRQIMNSVKPPCVLMTVADYDLFPLWYQQDILGVQPGVRIVKAMVLREEQTRDLGRRIRLIYPQGAPEFETRLAYAEDLQQTRPADPVFFSVAFKGVEVFRTLRAHFLPRGAAYRYHWDEGELERADVLAEWQRFKRWRTVRGVYDRDIAKDHNTQTLLAYSAYADYRRGHVLSLRPQGCRQAVPLYRAALDWPFWDVAGASIAHASLARCREALGDPKAALAEYRAAVQLAPEWPVALKGLAELHMKQGRYLEARRWFLRALTVDPDDAAVRRRLRALEDRDPAR